MALCGICRVKFTMADQIVHRNDDLACIFGTSETVKLSDAVATGHVHRACKEKDMTYYVEFGGDKEEFSTRADAEEYIRQLAEEDDQLDPDDITVVEGTERTVVIDKAITVRIE